MYKSTTKDLKFYGLHLAICGGCGGLMVSALNFGSSSTSLSPGWGHATLTALSTLVYKWVPAKFNAGGNPAMVYLPIQGRVEILLDASCYGNRETLRLDGPLGSYVYFTFLLDNQILSTRET